MSSAAPNIYSYFIDIAPRVWVGVTEGLSQSTACKGKKNEKIVEVG